MDPRAIFKVSYQAYLLLHTPFVSFLSFFLVCSVLFADSVVGITLTVI